MKLGIIKNVGLGCVLGLELVEELHHIICVYSWLICVSFAASGSSSNAVSKKCSRLSMILRPFTEMIEASLSILESESIES